jgi:co-chaperonin GroES (HSP10)
MTPEIVGHRLLVKPISLEEYDPTVARAKALGITLSEKTDRQEASIISSGVVVQIGPTAFAELEGQQWCKVGDRVDYVKHGGMFVHDPENKDNKWYVLNDEDILVIWRKEND